MSSQPIHFVFCYKCELDYKESPLGDYIELYHPYDSDKLLLTTHLREDSQELNDPISLREWQDHIMTARDDATGLESLDDNYSPIGKIQLVITEALRLKKLPSSSSSVYEIRIQHTPFTLQTNTTLASNDRIQWKQSFFLPIFDTFFPIKLEVVCKQNTGWILESKSEEVICTGEILVADIFTSSPEKTISHNVTLTYTDSAKKYREESSAKDTSPELSIILKNLSSMKSLFHPAPPDFVEGVKIDPDKFSSQKLKLGISRLKRILTGCLWFVGEIEDIFRCKYPIFSYICILALTHIILTQDIQGVISLLVMSLILMSVYKHPLVESRVKNFFGRYFFSPEHLNKDYHTPMVQTLEELLAKKEMDTEKWKYKLVDDDPLLNQLKQAKLTVMTVATILLRVTGFFEKLKNIIFWHDPKKTFMFLVFIFFAYCAAAVIPVRFIIIFAVWVEFQEGFTYYQLRNEYNATLTRKALHSLVKKYFGAHFQQIAENPSQSWPTMTNFESFQKKMIKELGTRFQLNLAEDTFQIYTTPNQLVNAIATCNKTLIYKSDPNEIIKVEPFIKTRVKDFCWELVNFVMNVPSDYYRVINPKKIDPHSAWKGKMKQQQDEDQIQFQVQAREETQHKKRRWEFELSLVVFFITIYEIYLLIHYLMNLADDT